MAGGVLRCDWSYIQVFDFVHSVSIIDILHVVFDRAQSVFLGDFLVILSSSPSHWHEPL